MKLFYERTGKGGTVELPHDLENIQVGVNGQDIVSIRGTHSGDGRVGTTEYQVGIEKGRSDTKDEIQHDEFEYIKIVERGLFRGNMNLTVITLTEIDQ